MSDESQPTTLGFRSDFNALHELWRMNQVIERQQTDVDEAKAALKQSKDDRDSLMVRINGYVVHRREQNIQEGLFAEGMESGPPLDQWRREGNNDHEHDGS